MKLILGFVLAAGMALAGATANATPAASGLARVNDAGVTQARAQVEQVQYRRRHFRRAYYGRPVVYRRGYHRRAYYRRPVYFARPAYYGPRCVVQYRRAYNPYYGYWVRRPVRICRW